MKNITVFSIIIFLIHSFCSSQNLIYNKIEELKKEGVKFQPIELLSLKEVGSIDINKFFKKTDNIYFFELNQSVEVNNSHLSIDVMLDGKNEVLELLEVRGDFYDYEIITDEGKVFHADEFNIKHFRGVVKGDEKSLVSLSFSDKNLSAIISTIKGSYTLSKIKDDNEYILFKERQLEKIPDFLCGTDTSKVKFAKNKFVKNNNYEQAVKVYFEVSNDIFEANSNDFGETVFFISSIFNQVSASYENAFIPLFISRIKIWTNQDNYNTLNNSIALNQFRNQNLNLLDFNHGYANLGHFLASSSDVAASASGGLAYIGDLCDNNSKYAYSAIRPISSVQPFPIYTWNTFVIAHEIGHNFGSPHTHDCHWNGNGTAIDGCGFVAGHGGCDGPLPEGGGTIMSYCHLLSGIGVNFSNPFGGFGNQPAALIGSNYNNALSNSCVGDYCDYSLSIFYDIEAGYFLHKEAQTDIEINSSIHSLGVAYLDAGNKVTLKPGFHAISGSTFKAFISGCGQVNSRRENAMMQYNEDIKLVKLYPNPTSSILYAEDLEGVTSWSLNDLNGNVVRSGKLKAGESKLEIRTQNLSQGIYYFNAILKDGKPYQESIIVKH